MLIESEHNMAREHREGSATEMVFMAFVSFVGEVFWLGDKAGPTT
jgi:hypothetical protein